MSDQVARYDRYGQFRATKEFELLFPHFQEGQKAAAQAICRQVLFRCGPKGALPQVSHVVDLGCGDGSLLRQIRDCWHSETALRDELPPLPTFLGFDNCSEMIGQAELACGDIKFVHAAGTFSETFEVLATAHGVHWQTTVLCCLSHTWFHLKQKEILDAVRKHRPAVLVIDVHGSWDRAVAAATARKPSEEEFRPLPRQSGSGRSPEEIVCLRTVPATVEGEPGVHRGIWSRTDKDWLFRTAQYAVQSKSFQGTEDSQPPRRPKTLKNAAETLKKLATAGSVTGACDYLCYSVFDHESGWGGMRAHVFVARDEVAKKLNDLYFEAVRRVVVEVLSVPGTGLRRLLEMFPSGEVGVILPFDPSRTYTRFIPLPAPGTQPTLSVTKLDKSDEPTPASPFEIAVQKAAELDLVLEEPNIHQHRFPSAYSLYQSLLARVSSPVGLLLADVGDYEMCTADLAYEVVETALLAGARNPSKRRAKAGSPEGRAARPVFFIVPYFVGTLPVFALVLQEPRTLPMESSGSQLFFALAHNLERQLRVSFSRERLQTIVLRGLIEGVFLEGEAPDAETLRGALDTALDYFKGENGSGGWLLNERPWQSWLIAMPGREIRSLREATDLGNTWLRKSLLEEEERVKGSMIRAISQVCKDVALFDKDGHEKFNEKLHPARAEKALKLIGELSRLAERQGPGLARVAGLFEGLLRLLVDKSAADGEKKNAYRLLKSSFCRELHNKGDRFRASFSGVAALLIACVERQPSEPKELATAALVKCANVLAADFESKDLHYGNLRRLYEGDYLESIVGAAAEWGEIFSRDPGTVSISYCEEIGCRSCSVTLRFNEPLFDEDKRTGGKVDSVRTAVQRFAGATAEAAKSASGLRVTMTATANSGFTWSAAVVP